MKALNEKDIQNLIHKILISFGRDEEHIENNMKFYSNIITSFWIPFQYHETNDYFIIKSYTVYNVNSRKCIFLDPLELSCLVYPSRPYTCRLYPVSFESYPHGKNKVVIDIRNCPGVGIGDEVNFQEIQRIQRGSFKAFIEDWDCFEKYVKNKDIIVTGTHSEHIFNDQQIRYFFRLDESKQKKHMYKELEKITKKIIEPLVEYGFIPEHPLVKLHNEKIDSNK